MKCLWIGLHIFERISDVRFSENCDNYLEWGKTYLPGLPEMR